MLGLRDLSVALGFVLAFAARPALADISVAKLQEAGGGGIVAAFAADANGLGTEVLVEVDGAARARALGLVPVSGNLATYRGPRSALPQLLAAAGVRSLWWSPPRRLQMDLASPAVLAPSARQDFGVDGSGVVVGVVDTGVDVTHPAFRRADGTSRVAWLLSYDQPPRGVHVALEEEMGCTARGDCAIFSQADIDVLLSSGSLGELPPDGIGHGSHVASIAAGSDATYAGVAPGAELVIVQAAAGTGSASDARLLEGTRFVFDRATEEGLPAVVNLSLGSSFGAHDGTSLLETSLSALGSCPGRVVVVAAGNDGSLYTGPSTKFPGPLGVHTEATVPLGSEVRIPLLMPGLAEGTISGSIFVWISSAPGDELRLAFDSGRGVTGSAGPGQSGAAAAKALGDPDDYQFALLNGVDEGLGFGITPGQSVFVLTGQFQSDRQFQLVLSGHGTARMWAEAGGELAATGVYFPRARTGGTVTVPGTSPGVVTVGASVNRSTWVDYTGADMFSYLGTLGSRASFSGAGPNQLGALKPDLLAPGGNVIAAMAAAADPRGNPDSMSQFASRGTCAEPLIECYVVDELHAVAAGTSMAAPLVTGAIALLLQRDGELTTETVRNLLRAGSAAVFGGGGLVGDGTGVLDVTGALLAQDQSAGGGEKLQVAEQSRFSLADAFLVPEPDLPLQGFAILRDGAGEPAGGFAPSRLTLQVDGPATGELASVTTGLAEFWLRAESGGGEQEVSIQLLLDGAPLLDTKLQLVVDSASYRGGAELGGGTCSWSAANRQGQSGWMALVLGLLVVSRRAGSVRLGSHAPRPLGGPGRTAD